MKYATYFHGTCADHLQDILQNGLGGYRTNRIWNDSYPQHTYFWSPDKMLEYESFGTASLQEATERARTYAMDSATAAIVRAKDCRIMVIEARLPVDWMEEDTSGVNMNEQGAVCTDKIIPRRMIKSIQVTQDLSLLKTVFMLQHFSCSNSRLVPTNLEKELIRFMSFDLVFMGDLEHHFEWEEVQIRRQKLSKLHAA